MRFGSEQNMGAQSQLFYFLLELFSKHEISLQYDSGEDKGPVQDCLFRSRASSINFFAESELWLKLLYIFVKMQTLTLKTLQNMKL